MIIDDYKWQQASGGLSCVVDPFYCQAFRSRVFEIRANDGGSLMCCPLSPRGDASGGSRYCGRALRIA
jgi:hypothetical protein